MKKRLWKRIICCATILTMVIGTTTGCASKDSNKDSNGVITLTIMDWESETMNTAMQDAFDNVFSKEHPNIKVKILPAPQGDYGLKVNQMISAKKAPDIFQAGHDMALSLSKKGMVTDFSEKANADTEFTQGFYPGTYELWKDGDKTIGFPSLLNVYGIFYNIDKLKEARLEIPQNGWTFDDLYQYADTLKDTANGKFGLYNFESNPFKVSLVSVSNGGQPFVDDIQNPTTITCDDKFIEATTQLRENIAKGAVAPPTYEAQNIQSSFTDGSIPMIQYGQWLIDDLIRNAPETLNWGYVANPVGTTGKQCATFDAVGWCSPTGLDHADEVWELMKFMSSDIYKTVIPVTPVAACANEDAAQEFFDKVTEDGHPEAAEAVKTMINAETRVEVRYLTTWGGDAGKIWDATWNDILESKNGKDVDAIPDMVNKVNELIKSQR